MPYLMLSLPPSPARHMFMGPPTSSSGACQYRHPDIEKVGAGFSRGCGSSWGTSTSPNPQPDSFGLTGDRTQFSESKDIGSNLTQYRASHATSQCLSLVTCEMKCQSSPPQQPKWDNDASLLSLGLDKAGCQLMRVPVLSCA